MDTHTQTKLKETPGKREAGKERRQKRIREGEGRGLLARKGEKSGNGRGDKTENDLVVIRFQDVQFCLRGGESMLCPPAECVGELASLKHSFRLTRCVQAGLEVRDGGRGYRERRGATFWCAGLNEEV